MIGDAILFFLDENQRQPRRPPSAHNWVQYHGETGDYDVTFDRDERTAVNPTGKRKLYRFQVQGPNAMQVLEKAAGGPLPEIKFFNMGEITIAGQDACARCTTACPASPAASSSARGTRARTSARRSSRPARSSA